MKRSEFLKRLGLGLGAAVAAPSLLKGEEYHKSSDKIKDGEQIAFWRQSSTDAISAEPTFMATTCYSTESPYLGYNLFTEDD